MSNDITTPSGAVAEAERLATTLANKPVEWGWHGSDLTSIHIAVNNDNIVDCTLYGAAEDFGTNTVSIEELGYFVESAERLTDLLAVVNAAQVYFREFDHCIGSWAQHDYPERRDMRDSLRKLFKKEEAHG